MGLPQKGDTHRERHTLDDFKTMETPSSELNDLNKPLQIDSWFLDANFPFGSYVSFGKGIFWMIFGWDVDEIDPQKWFDGF